MALILYTYAPCSTCRDAKRWLDQRGIRYENREIVDTPPTREELREMLGHQKGQLRRLFNVSGQDYRALNLKAKLPKMTQDDALGLLTSQGMLVKRPFVLGKNFGLVGFKTAEWETAFGM